MFHVANRRRTNTLMRCQKGGRSPRYLALNSSSVHGITETSLISTPFCQPTSLCRFEIPLVRERTNSSGVTQKLTAYTSSTRLSPQRRSTKVLLWYLGTIDILE